MKHIGYKATDKDGYSFNESRVSNKKVKYEIGIIELPEEEIDRRDKGECGRGLHLARELHLSFRYISNPTTILNAKYWECEYDDEDVLGKGNDKVRVSKLKVIREASYRDVDLPNKDRVFDNIEHILKIKEQKFTTYNKGEIVKNVLETVKRTCALDKESRDVGIVSIRLHSPVEWDSVRDSVWDSVNDSIWYSVRDSLWTSVRASVNDSIWYSIWDSLWDSIIVENDKNHGIPMIECILNGGIFRGVDEKGIAHVVVPALEKRKIDVKVKKEKEI